MPNTPNYTLPYPALSDAPNGPSQIGSLATTIDTLLAGTFAATDASLAARLLNFGLSFVNTDESTTNTAFSALTTAGPSVTLTTRGFAIAFWAATTYTAAGTNSCRMSVAVSGSTTIASSTGNMLVTTGVAATNDGLRAASFDLFTLNPGSNTFTCQYAATSGSTAHFLNRRLVVWAP